MSENTGIKNTKLADTYKSLDTEEWLDIHFTRPIGLWWARLFARFDIHPNVVTICSIVLGIISGFCFYSRDFFPNIMGVVFLMWANFYDSADGQLARMTGKKTRWGRILDGFAGDVWFYTIYLALCLRLMPLQIPGTAEQWGWWIFLPAAVSGLICHARQCALADYYRNIHLYFLKGETGSELDTFVQQRALLREASWRKNFWWCLFLWGYGNYTHGQERMTPRFQLLMKKLNEMKGTYDVDAFRRDFRLYSLPLMKYTNILTFNTRAIVLYVSCLADVPWVYFLCEMTLFLFLFLYMRFRHESMCAMFARRLEQHYYKLD